MKEHTLSLFLAVVHRNCLPSRSWFNASRASDLFITFSNHTAFTIALFTYSDARSHYFFLLILFHLGPVGCRNRFAVFFVSVLHVSILSLYISIQIPLHIISQFLVALGYQSCLSL